MCVFIPEGYSCEEKHSYTHTSYEGFFLSFLKLLTLLFYLGAVVASKNELRELLTNGEIASFAEASHELP